MGISHHRGPTGEHGGEDHLLGTFERKVKFCFIRRPCLLGNPRDMQEKVLEMGNSFHRGPTGVPRRGVHLVGTLRQ